MATSEEGRVELARRGFQAYTEGDLEGVLAYLDPEVEVFASPDFMNAGTFHGHQGFIAWVNAWNEAWESFQIEIESSEAAGERCVVTSVHQTGRGRISGVEINQRACYLHEVQGGRAVYLGLFASREEAIAKAAEREGAQPASSE